MDWTTVLSSTISAGAAVTVAGAFIKRAVDKAIDAKFDAYKERGKAEVKEEFRRHAKVFDQQYSALTTILELCYRARNASRLVVETLDPSDKKDPGIDLRSTLLDVQNFNGSLVNLLYVKRAIFPPEIFKAAHDLKGRLEAFTVVVRKLDKVSSENNAALIVGYHGDLRKCFDIIDKLYACIAEDVQQRLGVE